DDLGRFLRGEPIRARPASWRERLVKWARRRPTVAVLLGCCALAGVGLASGAVAYETRLRAALRGKTAEEERADANYQEARDTVRRMLGHAEGPGSAGTPKLLELRRHQQEEALAFFLRMAEQQGDQPAVRFEVALAHLQVCLLQLSLGRPDE